LSRTHTSSDVQVFLRFNHPLVPRSVSLVLCQNCRTVCELVVR
jgi:hypothetical protein